MLSWSATSKTAFAHAPELRHGEQIIALAIACGESRIALPAVYALAADMVESASALDLVENGASERPAVV